MITRSIYYNKQRDEFEFEEDDFGFGVIDNKYIYSLIPPHMVLDLKQKGGTYYSTNDPEVRYEIDFPIDDDIIELYYDIDDNVFFDCDGELVFNVINYVTPYDILMFKKNKETMIVNRKGGGRVELVWSDEED